jgi:hypothetical protein
MLLSDSSWLEGVCSRLGVVDAEVPHAAMAAWMVTCRVASLSCVSTQLAFGQALPDDLCMFCVCLLWAGTPWPLLQEQDVGKQNPFLALCKAAQLLRQVTRYIFGDLDAFVVRTSLGSHLPWCVITQDGCGRRPMPTVVAPTQCIAVTNIIHTPGAAAAAATTSSSILSGSVLSPQCSCRRK